ncbi:MAG TPA: glycosyltransferase, partial [Candidatus Obscuribacter sp.]|nr:glycosyltransferase [Candidatus Obscuribacter sp.]
MSEFTEQLACVPDAHSATNSGYPKISVVIPSYNQVQFLEMTLRPILNQDYPNTEIIIMDGGSTDGTVELLKQYERYVSYWVSEPDKGQAAAINRGMAMAT